MRIMHLMSTRDFSGAENVACQIINMFKNNTEFEMIYCSEISGNKKNLDDRNIKYVELEKFNYSNIKRKIKEWKPDIIHAHDSKAIVMASLFYKKAKIIAHFHGNHENMRKLTIKSFCIKLISKRIYKMIWVSDSSLNDYYYLEKIKDKSIVLYNVIDVKEIEKKANESDINDISDIIFLGRLSYPKDPIRLVNVLKNIVEKRKNTIINIVGDGEYGKEVKKFIIDNNLGKNIKLYGFQKNPYGLLNNSKIMIMTSRYEGTPMCALEAMSLGKVIVSTPTDGLKDIISLDIDGYYSSNNDELVSKIIKLLDNEKKYKEMSKNVLKKSNIINDTAKYKNKIIECYKG